MMRPIMPPAGGMMLGFPDVEVSVDTTSSEPAWAILADDDTPSPANIASVSVRELEQADHDRATVERYVDHLLGALRYAHEDLATTPGGISWLDVGRVPVRRLLRQAVRKLLALSSWAPFAQAPQLISNVAGSRLVDEREMSAREYRSCTVTWPGIAYLLGAPAPEESVGHGYASTTEVASATGDDTESLLVGLGSSMPSFVALSWSSRHVDTLVPVLNELARRGRRSLLLDLASDPAQAAPEISNDRIAVRGIPTTTFELSGGIPSPAHRPGSGATACVGRCVVLVDRLAAVVGSLLERSAGCTQPSWAATMHVEPLLADLLRRLQPQALISCNDTSPLGYLAVRTAEAAGVDTVYLQHGAWVGGEVAWPALHSRHVVVMGERDRALARTWMRHPEGAVHVLGQPRFDDLAAVDHVGQRAYLERLLHRRAGQMPDHIAVMATQPVSADRARRQLAAAVDGVRRAGVGWGLVIAAHPAQRHEVLERLLHEVAVTAGALPVVLADPGVAARDCLAGADALMSVSSTCGIEALLLDIPVLELALDAQRTLGLAEHGAAQLCSSAADIGAALGRAVQMPIPPAESKNAVCRWDGRTAAHVADLLEGHTSVHNLQPMSSPSSYGRTDYREESQWRRH
jgi:hypothetical protein